MAIAVMKHSNCVYFRVLIIYSFLIYTFPNNTERLRIDNVRNKYVRIEYEIKMSE